MGAITRWLLALLTGLMLMLPFASGPTAAWAAEPAAVPLHVALRVGNVYRFSAREKTYGAEGTLRLSAPAAEMRRWLAAGVDPVQLVRFQNLVEPWNSQIEANSGPLRLGTNIGRDYHFNGTFYSDEINFRSYPFGTLPLQLQVVADPSFPSSLSHPPRLQLKPNPAQSGVQRSSNMSGYRLSAWRLVPEQGGVEMQLIYNPMGWSALVKWVLPLTITMVVMLLTPNLRASFSSERLAIPPVVLLTLVFMQQAYRDSLPSLPYLTVLDGLYAFSYLVTLVFFCEFIWCANRNDRLGGACSAVGERRIERLELSLQLASLAGYSLLVAWAWGQS